MSVRGSVLLLAALLTGVACVSAMRTGTTRPPTELLGDFSDDYGSSYLVTADAFQQDARATYRVVAWHVDSQYLIAQNDSSNRSAPNRWTRIDWLTLRGMAPYTWGFCLSAYDAATQREAEAARVAQRESPRTGCNGFPFTRMRPRDR